MSPRPNEVDANSTDLHRALLEWSGQTIIRIDSSGSNRLFSAGLLTLDGDQHAPSTLLDMLRPADRERVYQLGLAAARTPGGRVQTTVEVSDTNGAVRDLDLRFVNAAHDERIGGLLIYAQDGAQSALADREVFVQAHSAAFAAAFAEAKTTRIQQTMEEQLQAFVSLVNADNGAVGYLSSSGENFGDLVVAGRRVATSRIELTDLVEDPTAWARRGEPLVVKLLDRPDLHSEPREFLLVPRVWNEGKIGFVVVSGPLGFWQPTMLPIAIVFADLVGFAISRQSSAQALVASEARLRTMIGQSSDFILLLDGKGRLTFVNSAAQTFLGLSEEEILGQNFQRFIEPEQHHHGLGVDGRVAADFSFRARRADGEIRWIDGTMQNFLSDPSIGSLLVNARDTTNYREAHDAVTDQAKATELIATVARRFARGRTRDAEANLTATAEDLRNYFEASMTVIWRTDERGIELRPVASLHDSGDLAQFEKSVPVRHLLHRAGHLRTGDVVVEDRNSDDRGGLIELIEEPLLPPIETLVAVPILSQNRLVGLITLSGWGRLKVSETSRIATRAVAEVLASSFSKFDAEQTLRRKASTDDLTGLVNRSALRELIDGAISELRSTGEVVSVALLDLDEFKVINDTMGHESGDELLRALAIRLRQATRNDDVLARLGGDEFVMLMRSNSSVSETEFRDRLCEVFSAPFMLRGKSIRLSASVGLAQATDDSMSADELLRRADIAMYQAKGSGRGQVQLFADHMSEAFLETQALVEEIRFGLDTDQFHAWLQPILQRGDCAETSDDLRPVGFEALARWHHHDKGLISPATFIPVAEQNGLIIELGDRIAMCAMSALQSLMSEGLATSSTFVAVNISTEQLETVGFSDRLVAWTLEYGLTPQQIHLELTESILAEERHLQRLLNMRALGYHLAIDDFGTGYSSLSYAREMPADSLKVDRSFVSGVATDRRDHALAAAVISLGRALGMRIVAEGVENDEQLRSLLELGCDRFQGFLFARPMPLEEVCAWLVHNESRTSV